jgi:hypothetical protein
VYLGHVELVLDETLLGVVLVLVLLLVLDAGVSEP